MGERLKGKVAFITGAGMGMGREAAVLFAEHGARVIVADIDGVICVPPSATRFVLSSQIDLEFMSAVWEAAVMDLSEGSRLLIDEGRVLVRSGGGSTEVARGHVLELEEIEKTLDTAKQAISHEIERFAENTISYIKDERDVLLEATRLPEVNTDFHGRHVLVVVRGYDYK